MSDDELIELLAAPLSDDQVKTAHLKHPMLRAYLGELERRLLMGYLTLDRTGRLEEDCRLYRAWRDLDGYFHRWFRVLGADQRQAFNDGFEAREAAASAALGADRRVAA